MRKYVKFLALILCAALLLPLMPAPHAHAHAELQGIEEYPELKLDTTYLVELTEPGMEAYFRFTPTTSEGYCLSSDSSVDTVGALFNSSMQMLAYSDDAPGQSGKGPFSVSYTLQAGTTYVYGVQLYNDNQTASFPIRLSVSHSYVGTVTKEPTCTEAGEITYTCEFCGDSYVDTAPPAHKYVDGFCCWCGKEYLITGSYTDTINWKLDFWGTLTISGTGDTGDWDSYNPSWTPYFEDITSVVVEEGITRLGHYALHYLPNVTSVTLPSSLRSIGFGTFQSMGAAELVIPEGVIEIDDMAFNNMDNLTSITLPSTLRTIGTLLFYECTALKEVVFPDNIMEMGTSTFVNCHSLERVVLPKNLPTIPESLLAGFYSLTEVILPEALVTIEDAAFADSWRLNNLELPDTLAYIGKYAFKGCSALTEMTFPAALMELGAQACANLYKTEKVVFLGDAPVIGENAFENTTSDVWYPAGNDTWTEDVCQNYGGTLTWHALCRSHTFGPWAAISGTCTEPGVEQRTCTACAWAETRDQEQAPGHRYEAVVTAPTCTSGGYTTYTCAACGDSYISDETAAAGHDYEAVVTPPTCAEEGYTTNTCSVCGDSYTSDPTEKTAHAYGPWSEVEGGTCISSGRHHRTCTACGHTQWEDVPAPGHQWIITEEPPTCTNQGALVYTCTVCGSVYREIIFAPGHQFEDVVTPPTCYGPGYTTHTCTVCGFYFSDNYTDALGHDLVETVIEPTCTEYGCTKTTCTRCAYESTSNQTAPLGHSWSEGVCTRCGAVDPGYIPEPEPSVNPFTDVSEESFYYEGVMWAVEQGITNGISDTEFGPNTNCTRAQVVTFLWRAAGKPAPTDTKHPFTDVTDDFYFDAMLWAVEKGITNGISSTEFGPNAPCSRAQVVTFLWRTAGKPAPTDTKHPFTDVSDDFYYDAMLWAVEQGITNGISATEFGPNTNCTRAQVVTFLYRAYH